MPGFPAGNAAALTPVSFSLLLFYQGWGWQVEMPLVLHSRGAVSPLPSVSLCILTNHNSPGIVHWWFPCSVSTCFYFSDIDSHVSNFVCFYFLCIKKIMPPPTQNPAMMISGLGGESTRRVSNFAEPKVRRCLKNGANLSKGTRASWECSPAKMRAIGASSKG